MTRRSFARWVVAVAAAICCRATPATAGAANDLNPNSWPGKNGLLKAGFIFDPADYKELNKWTIASDSREILKSAAGSPVHRQIVLGRKQPQELMIDIYVVATSTNDAQTILAIRNGTQFGALGGRPSVQLGSEVGLNIGDVCVIHGPAVPQQVDKLGELRFVRNNIVVTLAELSGGDAKVVDLAKAIDDKIKTQQGHTPGQLAAKLPAISSFVPSAPSVKTLGFVGINLAATDPLGLPLEYRFAASIGLIQRDDIVTPPTTTFYAHGKEGLSTLTVWCFDSALLMKKAETSLTVIP